MNHKNNMNHYFNKIFSFSMLIVLLSGFFQFAQAEDFLDPEVAFKASARMIAIDKVEVTFTMAKGYYLYREKFKFDSVGAQLGEIQIPKGKVKYDVTFEKEVETFYDKLVVVIPVVAKAGFTLNLGLQGCADLGLCYPPMDIKIPVRIFGSAAVSSMSDSSANNDKLNVNVNDGSGKIKPSNLDDMSHIAKVLQGGRLLIIVPVFFLLGLGLAFTPCVLPMIPILSFIIVGEGKDVGRRRSFLLSLCYVLGMALVYTALGIAAGLIGEGLSATLQNPWVLSSFAMLMVALSLAMFGVYQLQVPAAIQTKLTTWSETKRNGKLFGVFIMGAISALIVGPCVAAPLAGALVYISQSRDVVVGGAALFAMAIGMGVPLLLVGLSAGSLLPRAGAWMESIKRFFGVLMLALALWMVSPILPAKVQMAVWMILLIGYGVYLAFLSKGKKLAKFFGIIFMLLGSVQLIGLSTGGNDPLSPLSHWNENQTHVKFQRIKNTSELEQILASNQGKVVMFDFYADWCVSCIEMEKLTFNDPKVKAKLDQMLLLQIDVTANNADDKAMLKRFGLFGPPGIIFFDKDGKEIENKRVIGYQNSDRFFRSLEAVENNKIQ
jgi:thiol:disulfide interchange protein DsbD